MQSIEMSKQLADDAIDELEYCAVHFAHHFADAFAVVAFNHPDRGVRDQAYYVYYLVAEENFHFYPMNREQFLHRHRDKFGDDSA
jgi:hypothetical protein